MDGRSCRRKTHRLGAFLSAVFLLFSFVCASASLTACAAEDDEAGSQAVESEAAADSGEAADDVETDGDDAAGDETLGDDDAAGTEDAAEESGAASDDVASSDGEAGGEAADEGEESDADGGSSSEESSYGEAGVDFVADEIIIVYEGEALELDEALGLADDEEATLLSLGITSQETISTGEDGGVTVLVQLDGEASVEELVELLPQAPAIAAAQPNYLYSLQ